MEFRDRLINLTYIAVLELLASLLLLSRFLSRFLICKDDPKVEDNVDI